MFSDSFAGIAPVSAPAFVIAQFIGAGVAVAIHHLLMPKPLSAASVNSPANRSSKASHV